MLAIQCQINSGSLQGCQMPVSCVGLMELGTAEHRAGIGVAMVSRTLFTFASSAVPESKTEEVAAAAVT